MADESEAELFSEEDEVLGAKSNQQIPVNLKWISSKNGPTFFHPILDTVNASESNAIETYAAKIILAQNEQCVFITCWGWLY